MGDLGGHFLVRKSGRAMSKLSRGTRRNYRAEWEMQGDLGRMSFDFALGRSFGREQYLL